MGWGEAQQPIETAVTGTAEDVCRARDALTAAGVNGSTLAEQATRAAEILLLIKALAEIDT